MSHHISITPSAQGFDSNDSEPLLESALKAGLNFPYGCRNGFCGACRGKITQGESQYPKDYQPDCLSAEEQAEGYVLCCKAQAISDITLEINIIRDTAELEIKKFDVMVTEINRLTDDVIQLFLKQPDDKTMQFLAGQYIDFILEGHKPRAFSIANAPHNTDAIELHIRHVAGGIFTDQLFNEMKVGEKLHIEGPLGSFFLREDSDNPILLIAGGTGFAPLKGIIEHAIETGITRPIHFYHGVREEKDLYMNELAQSWADQNEHIQYTPVLSDVDDWAGRTGFVHQIVAEDYPDMSTFDVYMAGPPIMVDSAKIAFRKAGMDSNNLYYDSFEIAATS